MKPAPSSPSSDIVFYRTPVFWFWAAVVVVLFLALHFWAFLFVIGFAAGWWAKGNIAQRR